MPYLRYPELPRTAAGFAEDIVVDLLEDVAVLCANHGKTPATRGEVGGATDFNRLRRVSADGHRFSRIEVRVARRVRRRAPVGP
ncbi:MULTISPECIES: hypothetical protein [unclassified Nocardia]|uniref:hypothetical protein n=1 Tax=unclassified Nocardia TaxID=2637762 RepID=UPI001CE46696|nr:MULTISPECIES: hypothetical protein [unclassified Nocardia]